MYGLLFLGDPHIKDEAEPFGGAPLDQLLPHRSYRRTLPSPSLAGPRAAVRCLDDHRAASPALPSALSTALQHFSSWASPFYDWPVVEAFILDGIIGRRGNGLKSGACL